MYELLCRSAERPWAATPERLDCVPETANPKPLILHMQKHRSPLSQDARVCFSVIGLLLMVSSIGPVPHGHWLVPAFSILATAALTFALERHGKSTPAQETRKLADGRIRHRDGNGHQAELPAFRMRLAAPSMRACAIEHQASDQTALVKLQRSLIGQTNLHSTGEMK
jgi:hypothetical protein